MSNLDYKKKKNVSRTTTTAVQVKNKLYHSIALVSQPNTGLFRQTRLDYIVHKLSDVTLSMIQDR
jgi:hypothetical protein